MRNYQNGLMNYKSEIRSNPTTTTNGYQNKVSELNESEKKTSQSIREELGRIPGWGAPSVLKRLKPNVDDLFDIYE